MKKVIAALIMISIFSAGTLTVCHAGENSREYWLLNLTIGISKEELKGLYPEEEVRTYRIEDSEEWITFNHKTGEGEDGYVTFHLRDARVVDWNINSRQEVVEEYLSEFCSEIFKTKYQKIYQAIKNVLIKIPRQAFLLVTDRKCPTVFTEVHASGLGRLANSAQIAVFKDEPPAFSRGFWVTKLCTELNQAEDVEQIEGVILHEIAHRVFENTAEDRSLEEEGDAVNRQVIEWGFSEELKKASIKFGAAHE